MLKKILFDFLREIGFLCLLLHVGWFGGVGVYVGLYVWLYIRWLVFCVREIV